MKATATDRRSVSRTFVGLARACHLQPTVAVTAATTALALLAGQRISGAVAVAAAVLAGQCSVGWSNDWFDAGRDDATGQVHKPIVAGLVSAATVRNAALIALATSVPLSLLLGWQAAGVHLIAIGSAWAYNGRLKATAWSPLPYAISFGLLPAFITLGLPGHPWPRTNVMIATALLGTGVHFINTLGDRDADHATGITGLPQLMSAMGALSVGIILLGFAALLVWSLGDRLKMIQNALVLLAMGLDVLVLLSVRAARPERAQTWALASAGVCLVLFAVSRPVLTN